MSQQFSKRRQDQNDGVVGSIESFMLQGGNRSHKSDPTRDSLVDHMDQGKGRKTKNSISRLREKMGQ